MGRPGSLSGAVPGKDGTGRTDQAGQEIRTRREQGGGIGQDGGTGGTGGTCGSGDTGRTGKTRNPGEAGAVSETTDTGRMRSTAGNEPKKPNSRNPELTEGCKGHGREPAGKNRTAGTRTYKGEPQGTRRKQVEENPNNGRRKTWVAAELPGVWPRIPARSRRLRATSCSGKTRSSESRL